MTYNSYMNDTKLTIANALLILLKTQPLRLQSRRSQKKQI